VIQYGAHCTESIREHAAELVAHRRLCGSVLLHELWPGRPAPAARRQSAASLVGFAAAILGRTSIGRRGSILPGAPSIFSELVPTQFSRRRGPDSVPPSKSSPTARTLLMSECCLQSPFKPGRIGVHTMSPMIRSSNIHLLTAVSASRLLQLT
jgi:hypothetical protein